MAVSARHVCQREWSGPPGLHPHYGEFKVMTYNILANVYIQQGEYTYCPETIRYENTRAPHIVAQIRSYNPDVVCFQEVSVYHFTSVLQRSMKDIGYSGFHMQYRYHTHDGLCIFYKSCQFALLSERRFQIEDLIHVFSAGMNLCSQSASSLEALIRNSKGLLVGQFEHRITRKVVTIGNVHIRWSDLKLPGRQTLEIAVCYEALLKSATGGPFIFCGDFNTTPSFAPYRLLARGHLSPSEPAWSAFPDVRLFTFMLIHNGKHHVYRREEVSPAKKLEMLSAKDDNVHDVDGAVMRNFLSNFSTATPIKSAYKSINGCEPQITNCETKCWRGHIAESCLDYIWYTPDLQVTRVLQTPTVESIRQHLALPSALHPSDHIPIMAGFRFL